MRSCGDGAAAAIERANQRLAEFQRLRRWLLWPEPDLPRTSTGKVKRKAVAAWLASIQAASGTSENATARASAFGASADWLLALIASISGETPPGVGDELRLSEDLQLDSLGRVQLAAALEERLGIAADSGLIEEARTLGEVRRLVAGSRQTEATVPEEISAGVKAPDSNADISTQLKSCPDTSTPPRRFQPQRFLPIYRRMRRASTSIRAGPGYGLFNGCAWPSLKRWSGRWSGCWRTRRGCAGLAHCGEPMLIVANHVTTYDGPLVQYALPAAMRRRIAAAMSGEMIEDFRHFRNPERPLGQRGFYLPGPLIYLLLTALFNIFPLPRRRNFQRSFAHAGAAMDRGFNVLVFPEGTRSNEGRLARFRGGIGLLVKQSGVRVLPVAIRGLGELKAAGKGWFRSGRIEVHVGEPIRFAPEETETAITERLHDEVERLLKD